LRRIQGFLSGASETDNTDFTQHESGDEDGGIRQLLSRNPSANSSASKGQQSKRTSLFRLPQGDQLRNLPDSIHLTKKELQDGTASDKI
jgi:hypothetical protein